MPQNIFLSKKLNRCILIVLIVYYVKRTMHEWKNPNTQYQERMKTRYVPYNMPTVAAHYENHNKEDDHCKMQP